MRPAQPDRGRSLAASQPRSAWLVALSRLLADVERSFLPLLAFKPECLWSPALEFKPTPCLDPSSSLLISIHRDCHSDARRSARATMDAHQSAPPPFQRPPDRPMIHNPNHPPQPQAYAGYPSAATQQQRALHVPFSPDPYAASRRDPFLPAAPQHARRTSQSIPGEPSAVQSQAERYGDWTHAGTSQAHIRTPVGRPPVCWALC
jgi:hypothetical protein